MRDQVARYEIFCRQIGLGVIAAAILVDAVESNVYGARVYRLVGVVAVVVTRGVAVAVVIVLVQVFVGVVAVGVICDIVFRRKATLRRCRAIVHLRRMGHSGLGMLS